LKYGLPLAVDAPPLNDAGHVIGRIEHADDGLDGLHVRDETIVLLPVDLDSATYVGMKPDQIGNGWVCFACALNWGAMSTS
jgi:hypothetical protein